MDLQHLIVNVPLDGDLAVEPGQLITTFHRWVADQSMPELLIDVADLRHVPAGPGVILVGLEADYALDHTADRWGLLYRRKNVVDGSNADRVRLALGRAVAACRRLEQEYTGALTFSRTGFDLIVNDRALAPNTRQCREVAVPEITGIVRDLVGDPGATVAAHEGDARRRFGVTVTASRAMDFDALAVA